MSIWSVLGIVAIVLLVIYLKKRNAVWGGLTLGIIVGMIFAIISVLKKTGFDWYILKNSAIVGTLAGFIAELLGKAGDRMRDKA